MIWEAIRNGFTAGQFLAIFVACSANCFSKKSCRNKQTSFKIKPTQRKSLCSNTWALARPTWWWHELCGLQSHLQCQSTRLLSAPACSEPWMPFLEPGILTLSIPRCFPAGHRALRWFCVTIRRAALQRLRIWGMGGATTFKASFKSVV